MSDRRLRVLYLLPDGPVRGGMTMTTSRFYEHGVFDRDSLYHFNTYFTGTSRLGRLYESLWMKIRFLVALRRHRIEGVFVMTSSYWGFYDKIVYCLLARALGRKVILNPVGGHFATFLDSSPINRWLVPWLLRVPHLVATGTSYWVDYYKTTFGLRQVVVMPNPVLVKTGLPLRRVSEAELQVLFLTRVERTKGVWEFVEAVEHLIAADSSIKFVIAGTGSELEQVQARLARPISTGRVRVLGWVSEEDKVRLFHESDVYVLPTYFEVLSVAMLEAMSHGLAVIVTDVCGNSDAVEHGISGLLVAPQNASQIVEGILRLDRDRALMARVANAGYTRCRQSYSLDAVLARHTAAFQQLLQEQPGDLGNAR